MTRPVEIFMICEPGVVCIGSAFDWIEIVNVAQEYGWTPIESH